MTMTIEEFLNELEEEEKKGKYAKATDKSDDGEGMDPPGEEDSDIDNDGDSDDSDEYLSNRRKAIKKAMKEAFENLDEAKPEYNKDSVDKAIASSSRSGKKVSKKEASAIHRLLKGRSSKPKNESFEEEFELDEAELLEADGWIAFYNGKKLEIPKSDAVDGIWPAKQVAIKHFKVPKSKQGLLAIKPAYND